MFSLVNRLLTDSQIECEKSSATCSNKVAESKAVTSTDPNSNVRNLRKKRYLSPPQPGPLVQQTYEKQLCPQQNARDYQSHYVDPKQGHQPNGGLPALQPYRKTDPSQYYNSKRNTID